MKIRTISSIDNRIARLQALQKRLRAERRLAILREQHRSLITSEPQRIGELLPDLMDDIAARGSEE